MSEDDLSPADRAAARLASEPPPSGCGARLAWERERAGVTVNDVAARLRLHPKQVRAIENEDLAALPEPAYVRGFVRSYARMLGIDAAPLLAELDLRNAPTSESVVDGMTTYGDYSPVRAAAQESASQRLVIGLAVIGLVALGIIGWFATRERASPVAVPVAVSVAPASAGSAQPAFEPAAAPADAVEQKSGDEGDAPPPPPAEVAAERIALLKLVFSGPSWVEVTDAVGTVLVSEHKGAGDELALDGRAPLSVVIGDASRVSAEVRGEPFALTQVSRANVARFTVK
jgi:cytoskeleton protein RodZ